MTTTEEVIRLAREVIDAREPAGPEEVFCFYEFELIEFAQRIRAEENESCIEDVRTVGGKFAVECESLIRARRK